MQRLTRACVENQRLSLASLVVVTLLLGAGLPHVRAEYGYEILIGSDHPSIVDFERHVTTFGGGSAVKVAWECGPDWPCSHPLDSSSLMMADAVSDAMLQLNEVQRVYSPSNATLTVPDERGFAVRQLVTNHTLAPDYAALAIQAREDALWQGVLISDDETVGVLLVQARDTKIATSEVVLDTLLGVLAPWQQTGFEFAVVGNNVSGILAGRALDESVAILIPILVLVIGLVLFGLAHSWRESLVVLITMGIGVLWTFGLLGHLDWPQDGILEVLAPLVLVVGVCDAVHYLNRTRFHAHRGASRRESLVLGARDVGPACIATSATTGAALLSFTASGLDTFVRFGAIAAFGVVSCLILTFTLLPILSDHWVRQAAGNGPRSIPWDAALMRTTCFAQRHAAGILGLSATAMAVALAGIPMLVVDTDWQEMMGRHHPSIRWKDFQAQRLGHSETLEIAIELPDAAELAEPATLQAIARFGERVSSETSFANAHSVVDAIERANRAIHSDRQAYERLSDSAAGNGELVEMIGFDDPGLLASWLSSDRRVARVSIGTATPSNGEEAQSLATTRAIAEETLAPDWSVTFTGEPVVTLAFIAEITATQVRSFPIAVLLVWLIAAGHFRSVQLGTIAIAPTVLPALCLLGAMGWTGMTLDMGRSMVAVVIVGIGVDDAIHLLTAYRRARSSGEQPGQAVQAAVQTAGPALVMTSIALALGFLTLRMAAWATISSFGSLVACSILGALFTALLVIPASVTLLPGKSRTSSSPRKANETGRIQTDLPQ